MTVGEEIGGMGQWIEDLAAEHLRARKLRRPLRFHSISSQLPKAC
jgi:hypothetical protein